MLIGNRLQRLQANVAKLCDDFSDLRLELDVLQADHEHLRNAVRADAPARGAANVPKTMHTSERSGSPRSGPAEPKEKGTRDVHDIHRLMAPILGRSVDTESKARARDRVQNALRRGLASPHSWNGTGAPLTSVARVGDLGLVGILLEFNADADVQDAKGVSPLHSAVFDGHTEVVRQLLEFKASANIADCKGQTPLFFAPTPDMCDLLSDGGAQLGTLSRKGQSAVHAAALSRLGDVLLWFGVHAPRALLKHRDMSGFTAAAYASRSKVRVDVLTRFEHAIRRDPSPSRFVPRVAWPHPPYGVDPRNDGVTFDLTARPNVPGFPPPLSASAERVPSNVGWPGLVADTLENPQ